MTDEPNTRPTPAERPVDTGAVPERETWWLAERVGHQQYTDEHGERPSLTSDPWRAVRFATEKEAFDYILRLKTLRDEMLATQHIFINKPHREVRYAFPDRDPNLSWPKREIAERPVPQVREALKQIMQRANESGTGEMALLDTIHAMHKIARDAAALTARPSDAPEGAHPVFGPGIDAPRECFEAFDAERLCPHLEEVFPGAYRCKTCARDMIVPDHARPSDAAVAWRWPIGMYGDKWAVSSVNPGKDIDGVEPLYALPPDEPARVTPSTVETPWVCACCGTRGVTDGKSSRVTEPPALARPVPVAGETDDQVEKACAAYLADAPGDGRHSDAAGGNAYEVIAWAQEELAYFRTQLAEARKPTLATERVSDQESGMDDLTLVERLRFYRRGYDLLTPRSVAGMCEEAAAELDRLNASSPALPEKAVAWRPDDLRVQIACKIVGHIYTSPNAEVGPATQSTRERGLRIADEIIALIALPPDEPARVTPSTVGGEALEAILQNLDGLDQQRTPGPWRKAHDNVVGGYDNRDDQRRVRLIARCDAEWSGYDLDISKAPKNARFIVALENAWPKLRAALSPTIASEKERGKAAFKCSYCADKKIVGRRYWPDWKLIDEPCPKCAAPPAASLIAKGEGE